jgi:hypothetical protein
MAAMAHGGGPLSRRSLLLLLVGVAAAAAAAGATVVCTTNSSSSGMTACVGAFCGRALDDAGCTSTAAACGVRRACVVYCAKVATHPVPVAAVQPCPRGTRTNGYLCLPCEPAPVASYDVMFFVFWLLVVALSHWLAIYASPRPSPSATCVPLPLCACLSGALD